MTATHIDSMRQPRAFLQPASGPDAQRHLNRTMGKQWSVQELRSVLSPPKLEALHNSIGAGSFGIWGLLPKRVDRESSSNEQFWNDLRAGDLVLFYTEGKISYVGQVAHKDRDQKLAEHLWSKSDDGTTWELLYFLKDVTRKNLPMTSFAEALRIQNFAPQRFQPVTKPLPEVLAALQTGTRYDTILNTGRSATTFSFAFTEKDFKSCTGKKADAEYLSERFKALLGILKSALGEEFSFFKSYAARSFEQPRRGQKKVEYRDYMWLGFAHPKFERAQKGIQLQVWINDSHPLGIGIWIDERAPKSRKMAKENIEKDKKLFEQLLRSSSGHSAYLSGAYEFDESTTDMTTKEVEEFTEGMTDDVHVAVWKKISKEDALSEGSKVVNLIIDTFNQLLPTYLLLAGEEAGVKMSSDRSGLLSQATLLTLRQPQEPITIEQLQEETLLQRDFLETISRLLEDRKQVIFYGPPGTGKTFVAKKFATYFAARPENVEIVQFHPSYGYEDFVEGIKPRSSVTHVTYPVEDGIMKSICSRATASPNQKFVLIIDEINRGNIAKIFGELIHCLEYRGKDNCISLPYSQKPFYIPENVYIIGTMNSADRSIALVDFALRRRFNFIEFFPQPNLLKQWLDRNTTEIDTGKVIELLTKINERISNDDKLGEYFQIGHTYFMKKNLNMAKLHDIWSYSVMPLLKEYFFEEKEELDALQEIYRKTFSPA